MTSCGPKPAPIAPEPPPLTGNAYAHYVRGRLAAIEGDAQSAALEFGRAAQAAPGEPEIVVAYLEALTSARRTGDAVLVAERAEVKWPNRADVALASGRAYRKAGELAKAIDSLERARTFEPTAEDATLELAAALVAAKETERAIAVYRDVVAREGAATKPRLRLAHLLLDSGRPRDAKPVIEELLAKKESHTGARLLHSRILAALGDAKGETATLHQGFVASGRRMRFARETFARLMERGNHRLAASFALTLDDASPSPDVRAAIGRLLLRVGLPARALEIADRARASAPRSLEAALLAGTALASLRRFDEAAAAVLAVPFTPYSRIVAAEWLTLAGKVSDAQRVAGELDDDDPKKHYIVARIFELSGASARARRTFAVAIERWPADADLTFEAASFELRAGDPTRAVELATPLLAADPDDGLLANFVGYALAEAGSDLARAEELLRGALSQRPDDANVLDSYGWLLLQQKQLAKAAQTMRRAWRLAPAEPEILFHLARVEDELGRTAAAKRRYDEAFRLAIEPSLRRRIRQRLDRLSASREPAR